VKLMPRTSGFPISASPTTGPRPKTTLKTPGGSCAASAVPARSDATAEEVSAGFRTTVFPNARAGAAFQRGIATGKFQGVTRPTTPRGSRSVSWSVSGSCDGMTEPDSRTASPA